MAARYEKRDTKAATLEAAEPAPDAFERAREGVRTAYVAPAARRGPSPDPALAVAACEALASGAWPRELPVLLGVPPGRWRRWLEQGAADLELEHDTPEAALAGAVARARSRLEQGLRGSLERLANNRAGWQAAQWLLERLSPGRYSARADELVEAEIRRLLVVARDALTPEAFAALAAALERARDGQAAGD